MEAAFCGGSRSWMLSAKTGWAYQTPKNGQKMGA